MLSFPFEPHNFVAKKKRKTERKKEKQNKNPLRIGWVFFSQSQIEHCIVRCVLIQVVAFSQGSLRYGGLIHKACVLISPQSARNASQMSSFQLFPPCLILSDIDSSYLFVHWQDKTQTAVVFSTYTGCV